MDQCDIIISSTTSPHYTVTKDLLERFNKGRETKGIY